MSRFRVFVALSLALALALPQGTFSADHREAPAVDEEPTGDIADVFAFLDPNDPARLVLAMTVNPLSVPTFSGTYFFSRELLYQFKIDNDGDAKEDFVIQAVFEGALAAQRFRVSGPARPVPDSVGARNRLLPAGTAEVRGPTGQVVNDPSGLQVFAGLRDDPFVADASQFFRIFVTDTQDVFRDLSSPLGPRAAGAGQRHQRIGRLRWLQRFRPCRIHPQVAGPGLDVAAEHLGHHQPPAAPGTGAGPIGQNLPAVRTQWPAVFLQRVCPGIYEGPFQLRDARCGRSHFRVPGA